MSLKPFIDTTRQKVSGLDYAADAYINYANSVTGAEDTNVGDAIMTLADGYGQGGGGGESPVYPLDGIKWTDDCWYSTSNGNFEARAGEHCTPAFQIDGTYSFTASGGTVYLWDEHHVFLGFAGAPTTVFSAKGCSFAVKIYDNSGNFNPESYRHSLAKVDNSATAIPHTEINLADLSWNTVGGNRVEADITSYINSPATQIKSINYSFATKSGYNSRPIPCFFYNYGGKILIVTSYFKDATAAAAYYAANNIKLIIN